MWAIIYRLLQIVVIAQGSLDQLADLHMAEIERERQLFVYGLSWEEESGSQCRVNLQHHEATRVQPGASHINALDGNESIHQGRSAAEVDIDEQKKGEAAETLQGYVKAKSPAVRYIAAEGGDYQLDGTLGNATVREHEERALLQQGFAVGHDEENNFGDKYGDVGLNEEQRNMPSTNHFPGSLGIAMARSIHNEIDDVRTPRGGNGVKYLARVAASIWKLCRQAAFKAAKDLQRKHDIRVNDEYKVLALITFLYFGQSNVTFSWYLCGSADTQRNVTFGSSSTSFWLLECRPSAYS
jgi:hypothetical protein